MTLDRRAHVHPMMGASRRTAKSGASDALALAFVLVLSVVYATLGVRRHMTFHTAGWDLGIFEQAIRHYSTFSAPISLLKGAGYNLLGDHFHPILVVLAPVYALFPSPLALIVGQALLFALAAWPLVTWARNTLGLPLAIVVGTVYGLSFGIAAAVGFDFHEIAFAVPLIAFSLSALGQNRLSTAAGFALPLVLVKEDLGLSVVAAIGALIFLRGRRRLGSLVAVAGVGSSLFAILVFLPAINSAGGYDYWTKVAGHPILQVLTAESGVKAATLLATIAISGFLAVRSPIVLVALPTLLWRFAIQDAHYWGTHFHYSAVLMPIVTAAMIDGIVRLRRSNCRWSGRIERVGIVTAVLATALLLPSHPLAQLASARLWSPNPRSAAITTALSIIPDGATVSASDDLVPHLTSRASVTLFGLRPLSVDEPQWIIVDPSSTRHFTIHRAAEQRDLRGAESAGYFVVFAQDGITVLTINGPVGRRLEPDV